MLLVNYFDLAYLFVVYFSLLLKIDWALIYSQGWKLPDFMFATRRSLSDACNNVGSQIDGFYESLSVSSYFPYFLDMTIELYFDHL